MIKKRIVLCLIGVAAFIGLFFLIFFVNWASYAFLDYSLGPDAYPRTSYDTKYDIGCNIQGRILLDDLDVYYPQGFICSSWLQEEEYASKTKCSCYRGRPIEVITYYRETRDIININSDVQFRGEEKIE